MKLFFKIAISIVILALVIIAMAAVIIGRTFTGFITFIALILVLIVAFSK